MISISKRGQRIILSRQAPQIENNYIIITNDEELIITNFYEIVIA